MKIYATDPSGVEHELEGPDGWRVMEVIRDYGLPIKAECGGACACATCHVYVDPNWMERLPPMREEEEHMLDEATAPVLETSRLSCQLICADELDGLKLTLAPMGD